ncbi:unnamed protein product [Clonostachys rhizophaga]|uniref:Uncharacterized protein n=1 Tax=Clonostachys rhizophaga TaxID=160324 RepID=A0A9N9VZG6_9HYPO|nr:unnamed protein product [Clonostachys rhizophaga]
MSGAPGLGKTITAELLAPQIDAIGIPHDIIKSQLLENGMSFKDAGKTIIDRSRELARKHNFVYWYVELSANPDNLTVLDPPLRARPNPLRSQRVAIDESPADVDSADQAKTGEVAQERFRSMVANPCRPEGNVIMVDAYSSLDGRIKYILDQISAMTGL